MRGFAPLCRYAGLGCMHYLETQARAVSSQVVLEPLQLG